MTSAEPYQATTGSEGRLERLQSTLAEHWFSYLLFLPTLLFLILVLWIPFVRGVWISFHEWPFLGDPQWLGFGNYEYLFEWDVFYTSLKATFVFATTTLIQVTVAVVAALLVADLSRFKSVVSSVFLVPYTMPPIVTGTLWLYLLEPDFGPVFHYLTAFGVLEEVIYWSTEGDAAMAVITLVTAWIFWPFMFLIILATLENIPDEYYESAQVYGANRIQTFLHITLPQIKSAVLVAVSIRMVWNLTKISQILQMTRGGPGFDTSILSVLLYRLAFERGDLGLAYAVGIVLLLMSLAFIALFLREFQREVGGVGQ